MAERKQLSDAELKAIFDAEYRSAMGEWSGELAEERSTAMERYLAEPLGTEMEGRSQVQTRDVMDVIEWILPSLIRIFTDSDSAVDIEPVGPEDEPQAEQETDYLNYVFYKKNPGFLILYSWFKDALIQKNGITKHYVDEKEKQTRETYRNLVDEEFSYLNTQPDLELIEHEMEQMQADTGEIIAVHHATFVRSEEDKSIVIEVMPPEEFLISNDANSVDPKCARFTAHKTTYTVSELLEMGYSQGQIDTMAMEDIPDTEESLSRNHLSDEDTYHDTVNSQMRKVFVVEGYLKVDQNGDGIAELLKVFRSGEFIEYEEVDQVPFNAITPIILTHKFFGLSIADILKDLQEIRTGLMRSYMDNVNQLINGTTYYDENKVNVDDLLTSKPFGLRAVDGSPHDAVLERPSTGLPPQAFTLFELTDQLKNERVGDFQAQLDPNVLAQANTGVVMGMMQEAKAKVEMIARIFAETGVKSLFRDIHELARKYGNKEEIVKLRGNWLPVNPTEWRERTNFTVKVGLGVKGSRENLANLDMLWTKQVEALQMGFATPQNLYDTGKRLAEMMSHPNPQMAFTDPQSIPPQPPQPDPNMLLIQSNQQIEAEKRQVEMQRIQLDAQKAELDAQIKSQQLQVTAQTNMAKAEVERIKTELAEAKLLSDTRNNETKAQIDARTAELEAQLKQQQQIIDQNESAAKLAVEQYKADLASQTDLLQSQMKAAPKEAMGATNVLISDLMDKIDNLSVELNTSKEIVRDSEGRIISIGNKKVKRDAAGRATSIG